MTGEAHSYVRDATRIPGLDTPRLPKPFKRPGPKSLAECAMPVFLLLARPSLSQKAVRGGPKACLGSLKPGANSRKYPTCKRQSWSSRAPYETMTSLAFANLGKLGWEGGGVAGFGHLEEDAETDDTNPGSSR